MKIKTELNILYLVGKYNSNKTRLIILKLKIQYTKKRMLSRRNLKTFNYGRKTNIYINADRTTSKNLRRLKVELKEKRVEAQSKILDIRY